MPSHSIKRFRDEGTCSFPSTSQWIELDPGSCDWAGGEEGDFALFLEPLGRPLNFLDGGRVEDEGMVESMSTLDPDGIGEADMIKSNRVSLADSNGGEDRPLSCVLSEIQNSLRCC